MGARGGEGEFQGKGRDSGGAIDLVQCGPDHRLKQCGVERGRQREGERGGQSSGQSWRTDNPRQPGAVAMGAEVLQRARAGILESTCREQVQDMGAGRDVGVARERLAQEAEAKERVQWRDVDGLAARFGVGVRFWFRTAEADGHEPTGKIGDAALVHSAVDEALDVRHACRVGALQREVSQPRGLSLKESAMQHGEEVVDERGAGPPDNARGFSLVKARALKRQAVRANRAKSLPGVFRQIVELRGKRAGQVKFGIAPIARVSLLPPFFGEAWERGEFGLQLGTTDDGVFGLAQADEQFLPARRLVELAADIEDGCFQVAGELLQT